MRKHIAGALLAAVVLTGPACILQLALGIEFVDDASDLVDRIFTAMDTHATTALCTTFFNQVQCRYFVNGELIGSTFQFSSELGVVIGAIVDPMVLELPAGATAIGGTYDDGAGHTGNLLVYPNLSFVPADDTRTFVAGPGKQLAIVDLPAGLPVDNVDYHLSLNFSQLVPKGTGPTELKAIATGRLVVNGKTYYPPMLPCTTDFSTVPAIVMPRGGSSPQPLTIPTGLAGCQNRRYGYFRAESGPPQTCDLDNDHDVDRNDVALVMAVRNQPAAAGDPRDVNHDGVVNADDGRVCTTQCTRLRCTP